MQQEGKKQEDCVTKSLSLWPVFFLACLYANE